MIIIVGISFLVWFLKRKKIQRKSNASSFELLNASSTLPSMRKEELDRSSINPVPKPPRTGVYGEAFSRMSLALPREDSRQRLVWQDDLNSNYVSSPCMMFSRPEHSDTSSSLISSPSPQSVWQGTRTLRSLWPVVRVKSYSSLNPDT